MAQKAENRTPSSRGFRGNKGSRRRPLNIPRLSLREGERRGQRPRKIVISVINTKPTSIIFIFEG